MHLMPLNIGKSLNKLSSTKNLSMKLSSMLSKISQKSLSKHLKSLTYYFKIYTHIRKFYMDAYVKLM